MKDKTKITKCLFPAAGYGTRFLPATKAIPKEHTNKYGVIAYKFQGKRFDCGSVDGFVEATNYFYEFGR